MVMWTVTYADGTMNQTLEHLIFILQEGHLRSSSKGD